MLLFWIAAGLLTVAVVLAVTRPLYRASAGTAHATGSDDAAANVAVYRDQLAEIDADLARGLVSEAEAEAARTEISRRLLAHSDAGNGQSAVGSRDAAAIAGTSGRHRLFNVLAAAVPLLALAIYLAQGSPNMPGQPFAERLARAPAANADVDELVARVEARLRENPADGQGWEVVAPVYLKLERFREAVDAYRKAIELLGETPRRLSGYAESLVLANDGIVTEEAKRTYSRILVLEPDRVEARFGIALALEQDGDIDGAEKAYEEILATSPRFAPWRPFIAERLDALAAKRGGPSKAPVADGRGPAPDQAAAEVIAGMPEGERRQMIEQMVASLDQRLTANGNDPEGWQRLVRSWAVLGDKAKAVDALARARKALAADATALGQLEALAKGLGL